jgi:hypothetical protein
MKAVRPRSHPVEKSLENEDASASWHPAVIKSAGEPEFLIGPNWGSIKGIYPFVLPFGRGGTRYLTEDFCCSHRLSQIGTTPLASTSINRFQLKKYGFNYEDLKPRPKDTNYTVEISYAESGNCQ